MDPIIEVVNVKKYFSVRGSLFKKVKAVDNVSFTLERGETFGVVGETGSGKSTLGRVILRLIEPTGGKVFFEGKDTASIRGEELKRFRRNAQMVFQDPHTSLNPKLTIAETLMEPLREYQIFVEDSERFLIEQLEIVGLGKQHLYRYPHELSGGQKQRVAILRAILPKPKFLVLDEPTSALDVSVQAQILNMLKDIQRRLNATYMFISHDLSVVKYMSDRIAVMYLGKFMEIGNSDEIFEKPLHPYTQALFSAIPIPDPKTTRTRKRLKISGEPPSPINVPPGCRFHPRCPFFMKGICDAREPPLAEAEEGHQVACRLYSKR